MQFSILKTLVLQDLLDRHHFAGFKDRGLEDDAERAIAYDAFGGVGDCFGAIVAVVVGGGGGSIFCGGRTVSVGGGGRDGISVVVVVVGIVIAEHGSIVGAGSGESRKDRSCIG